MLIHVKTRHVDQMDVQVLVLMQIVNHRLQQLHVLLLQLAHQHTILVVVAVVNVHRVVNGEIQVWVLQIIVIVDFMVVILEDVI